MNAYERNQQGAKNLPSQPLVGSRGAEGDGDR
jgi:hypothetical protein